MVDISNLNSIKNNYQNKRYLMTASDENIESRLESLANNLWTTNLNGEIIPSSYANKLFKLYQDTVIEKHLRTNDILILPTISEIIQKGSNSYTKPQLDRVIDFDISQCFVRFSKKEYILDAYQKGRFKIHPASKYAESDMNHAQYDNELQNVTVFTGQQLKAELFDENGNKIPVKFNELFNLRRSDNFYTLCFASKFDRRLFDGFEADSALVIHDKKKFLYRMMVSMCIQQPQLNGIADNVKYYDPYNPPDLRDIKPVLCKDFSYLYQSEFRPVWEYQRPTTMGPFFLEVGSLSDISTIVNLKR